MGSLELKPFVSKIPFKISGEKTDPSDINYDIFGYHKKRTIIKGELRQIDYYVNYDYTANTYSNLILTEYRDYVRDSIGIVQYRNMNIYWYCEDETTGATKSGIKYYSPEESIQEGVDRRTNMIAFAKTTLLSELKSVVGEPTNQTYAFDLLTTVKTQMDYFYQGYTQPLRDAISASTKAYMGVCQQDRIAVNTIVNPILSQTDSIAINGIVFSFDSSLTPTKSEIANGLINLVTGTTATSVSNYVSVIHTDIDNGIFDIKAKIPGWPYTLSASTNIVLSAVTANNNTLKINVIDQLTF